DTDGALVERMGALLDGEYQKYAVESGAFAREKFFGDDPRLAALVDDKDDDDRTFTLPRGGHDRRKVYAAYDRARRHTGAPSVILANTVKGYGLGTEIEARNASHQIKKMKQPQLAALRDRLGLSSWLTEDDLTADKAPY